MYIEILFFQSNNIQYINYDIDFMPFWGNIRFSVLALSELRDLTFLMKPQQAWIQKYHSHVIMVIAWSENPRSNVFLLVVGVHQYLRVRMWFAQKILQNLPKDQTSDYMYIHFLLEVTDITVKSSEKYIGLDSPIYICIL